MTQHRHRLEEKEKRTLTAGELFRATHTKKGSGEFITPKASQIHESIGQKMVERYGDDVVAHPHCDVELWAEVAGGKKKGRLYGFGMPRDIDYVLTGTTRGCSSTGRSGIDYVDEVQGLKEELECTQSKMEDREKTMRLMDERMKAMEAMFQERFPTPALDDRL